MKPMRSPEDTRMRRELARLLRRLRTIRQHRASGDELVEGLNLALADVGSIRRLVTSSEDPLPQIGVLVPVRAR